MNILGRPQRAVWSDCRSGNPPRRLVGNFLTEELNMKNLITRFVKDESGPSAIEYGLIAALISVVCIAAMTLVGNRLDATYNAVAAALAG
jgi:pilus assembly protein Flp/PilA